MINKNAPDMTGWHFSRPEKGVFNRLQIFDGDKQWKLSHPTQRWLNYGKCWLFLFLVEGCVYTLLLRPRQFETSVRHKRTRLTRARTAWSAKSRFNSIRSIIFLFYIFYNLTMPICCVALFSLSTCLHCGWLTSMCESVCVWCLVMIFGFGNFYPERVLKYHCIRALIVSYHIERNLMNSMFWAVMRINSIELDIMHFVFFLVLRDEMTGKTIFQLFNVFILLLNSSNTR